MKVTKYIMNIMEIGDILDIFDIMDIIDIMDITDIMEIMDMMDIIDIRNNCLDGHGWCSFGPCSVRFCPFLSFWWFLLSVLLSAHLKIFSVSHIHEKRAENNLLLPKGQTKSLGQSPSQDLEKTVTRLIQVQV